MAINFELLVKSIVFEQVESTQPLSQYLAGLLQDIPDYKLAVPNNTNEEAFAGNLIELAWRIKYGTGYNSATNTEIARYRAFWPIIDFTIQLLNNITKRELKDINFNINLNDILTSTGKPGVDTNALIEVADSLKTPRTYNVKERRIADVKFSTGSLAGEAYKNKTPLDAVLDAIDTVKGYNKKEVTDIMERPRKYDLPASIKLNELMPIRRIAQSLYLFYVNKLKNPLYFTVLQSLIPELASKTMEEISNIIDKSVGQQTPQNQDLQEDFINFIKGKSKILVNLVQESVINKLNKKFLNELSSAEIAAGGRRTYQGVVPQNQKQQTREKTWKPTDKPIIKNINDFKQGPGIDQQIEDAYTDFYNTLTKGTTPSGWQKAGSALNTLFRGLDSIGDTLSRLG
jgi:hypothetical protein